MDACNLYTCVLQCADECGWSRTAGKCINIKFGASTSQAEVAERLGACTAAADEGGGKDDSTITVVVVVVAVLACIVLVGGAAIVYHRCATAGTDAEVRVRAQGKSCFRGRVRVRHQHMSPIVPCRQLKRHGDVPSSSAVLMSTFRCCPRTPALSARAHTVPSTDSKLHGEPGAR